MSGAVDLIVPTSEGLFWTALVVGLSAWIHVRLCFLFFFSEGSILNLPWLKPAFLAVTAASFIFLVAFLQISFGIANWQYLPLTTALAAGILLSCLSPTVSLVFFVWNLLVRPWELFSGVAVLEMLPRALAALAIMVWLVSMLLRKEIRLTSDVVGWSFLLLLMALLFSAFMSVNPEESLSYLLGKFIPITVLFFLILNIISTRRQLDLLLGTILVAVLAIAVVAVLLTIIDPRLRFAAGGRLVGLGLLSNPNDLAALIVMILPFLIQRALRKVGSLGLVLGKGVVFVIAVMGLWLAQSRAVLLALSCCLVVYLVLCLKGIKNLPAVFFVVAIVVVLWFSVSLRDHSDLHLSRLSRLNYVETGYKMFKSNPLLGVGVGNYPKLYERFSSLFIERGARTAHSSWVLAMAEAGVLGLFSLALLFLLCFYRAWQLRGVAPEYLIALVGYGVSMSLLSHLYLFVPYLLCGLIVVRYKIFLAEGHKSS